MVENVMNNIKKGIFFIIMGALSFATMSLFIQLSGDVPFMQKAIFRNLVAVLFSFTIIMRRGRDFSFKKENLPFLFLRSIAGLAGILLNFYAIEHLPLADAATVGKLSPFFVILFSFFILKERVKLWQIGCIVIAFFGSVFIINPNMITSIFTAETLNLGLTSIPAIAGITGAMTAGFAYTMIRKLSIGGERGPFIVFFFSAFSTIVCLPFAIVGYEPMSITQFLFLLGAGLCASVGQFSITAAYGAAAGKDISVYDYTQIIFAAIYSLIFFGQLPTGYSLIGYVIVVSVAVFMYLKEKKENEISV